MNEPATDRPRDEDRLNDAIVEYFELIDRGQTVDLAEFISSRGQLAKGLEDFFETASLVESMAGPRISDQAGFPSPFVALDPRETSGGAARDTKIRRRPHLVTPSQFGRYQVERELGHGAMGSVYLAYDSQLARRVALKIPIFDELEEPEMIERFYREARAAATLRSPGICPVFDVDKFDGMHFIAMAFIEGESLAEWIRDSNTSPREIAAIIQKLAIALQKAHDAGVIHRDLKPSNIMIDTDGDPVVMDFGLARRVATSDSSQHAGAGDIDTIENGAIVGSPAYMSPEQVMSDTDSLGPASDVYSLGVILYEMLSKQLPFQGSVISVVGQIVAEDPQPPHAIQPGADPQLSAICARMMAKRVDDRYRTMQHVAEALDHYLNQPSQPPIVAKLATVQYAPKPLEPVSPPPENTRGASRLAWGLTICLVGLAVVIALAIRSTGPILSMLSDADEPNAATAFSEGDAETLLGQPDANETPEAESGVFRSSPPQAKPRTTPARMPSMRYRFRADEIYAYGIEATAKFGARTETLTGMLTYRVVETEKTRTKLAFSSQLSVKSNSRTPGFARLRTAPSLEHFVAVCPQSMLTIDAQGGLAQGGCQKPLPFGLGDLSRLVLEPLPKTRTFKWQETANRAIYVPGEARFPFSPFHRRPESVKTVLMTTDYTAQSNNSEVSVRKTYSLADANPAARIKGDGGFVFDRKMGLVKRSETNVTVGDGLGQTVRINIKCRLLDREELKSRLAEIHAQTPGVSSKQEQHVESLSQPPDPAPGKAVTAETELKVDDEIQAYRMRQWRDVRVLELLDDGRVKVHWVGFGSELDETLDRSRLRLWRETSK